MSDRIFVITLRDGKILKVQASSFSVNESGAVLFWAGETTLIEAYGADIWHQVYELR